MRLDTAERFLPPIRGQIAFGARVEIVPGITAIAVPGHTPGQLAPVMTSEGEQLLTLAGNVLTRRFIQQTRSCTMILVVGATGYLGRETTKLLLNRGERVRVLARTPAKAADLEEIGAEVVQGDLIDPPSVKRACAGVQNIFSTAHSLLGAGKYKSEYVDGTGHRTLIDGAKAAGVAHFVYTSILGASSVHPVDFFRTKADVESYLKASGLSYTILRPAAFMEWHMHMFNGKSILEQGKTTILGKGTKQRNFVAVRDVARVAALALTDPAARNRTIDIGGPQNLSNNEVAALYATLAGVTPKINHMPRAVARILSIVMKPFQPGVSRIMYIASLPDHAFSETFDSKASQEGNHPSLISPEAFVRERIAEAMPKLPA